MGKIATKNLVGELLSPQKKRQNTSPSKGEKFDRNEFLSYPKRRKSLRSSHGSLGVQKF